MSGSKSVLEHRSMVWLVLTLGIQLRPLVVAHERPSHASCGLEPLVMSHSRGPTLLDCGTTQPTIGSEFNGKEREGQNKLGGRFDVAAFLDGENSLFSIGI